MSQVQLLLGHVSVGVFFTCLALWWCINIFKDFYLSKFRKGQHYVNRPWYPTPFFQRIPLDSLIKILYSTCVMGTIAYLTKPVLFIYHPLNLLHFIMAVAILPNAICELLTCNHINVFPLLGGIEVATAIMAFLHEAILFNAHTVGRNPRDTFIHSIIVYTDLASALVIYLETLNRHSPMLSLARTYLVQLQGTWFMQIAAGYLSSHENFPDIHIAAALLVVHSIANFIYILFVGSIVYQYMKKKGLIYIDNQESIFSNITGYHDDKAQSLLKTTTCEVPT